MKQINKQEAVFSEKTNVPSPTFYTAVTLEIRSRSLKFNKLFFMLQLYIHENLVRLQPLVHNILCTQESVTPAPTPMGSAQKAIPSDVCVCGLECVCVCGGGVG